MLLSRRSLSTYLPRTPPRIEAKSYSGRNSSFRWFAFFIKPSFLSRRHSSVDDSDYIVFFGMSYDQQFFFCGFADGKKPRFVFGVIFARESLNLARPIDGDDVYRLMIGVYNNAQHG